MSLRALLASTLLVSLAACSKPPASQQDLDSLDRELTDANSTGNGKDPALTAALGDQILVDPALAQSSNGNAVRPPSRPDSGAIPPDAATAAVDTVDARSLTPAPAAKPDCPECRAKRRAFTPEALAAQQAMPQSASCAGGLRYSAGWADRLPADLPLYPDARVAEAAGSEDAGCALRVVSFSSSAAPAKMIDWYYARVRTAGYSAEHKLDGADHLLGGARGGSAYMIYVAPRSGGGSSVDIVANAGS